MSVCSCVRVRVPLHLHACARVCVRACAHKRGGLVHRFEVYVPYEPVPLRLVFAYPTSVPDTA